MAPWPGWMRLACIAIIVTSTLVAVGFDLSIHLLALAHHHGQVPGDFMQFWGNARRVLDPRAQLGAAAANLPYPPPFLLFTAPLARLRPLYAYMVWILAGNVALVLAARVVDIPWKRIGLGLLAQPELFCISMGQSGILVSAFLLVALGLAARRPGLAGLAAGAVIIKPQFGLLLPLSYLAGGHRRAFFTAAGCVFALILLATLCFGIGVWQHFGARPVAGAQGMLVSAWPAKFQIMMVTPLVTLRSLGMEFWPAMAGQALVSLAAGLGCWRLWRREMPVLLRLAPTLCLAALATPYAYVYDLPGLALALAGLLGHMPRRGLAALTLLFGFTGAYGFLSVYYFSTGALFLAAILLIIWPYEHLRRPSLLY